MRPGAIRIQNQLEPRDCLCILVPHRALPDLQRMKLFAGDTAMRD
jgi:hypothetical protein